MAMRLVPLRVSIVRAIVAKDLREYSRDRLWMILTPLVLVAFTLVFWLLPSTVDESFVVGVHQEGMGTLIERLEQGTASNEGFTIVEFGSAEELARAVEGETEAVGPDGRKVSVPVGVDFGTSFRSDVEAGRTAAVDVYVSPDAGEETRTAVTAFVRELAYSLAGDEPPVTMPEESELILGADRAGAQVPLRERMRPIIVFIILLTESFALSSLVANEVRTKTAVAISVTPASTGDIIAAKTVTGTALALGQAVILLAATRTFTWGNWPMLLAAALLGAALATGVGMASGAAGRDFMGTLFIGMAFLIPMMVPAFAVLFPGTPSGWITALPSYGVIQALVAVTSYGAGWADILGYLGLSAAWIAALGAFAVLALGRKVASL